MATADDISLRVGRLEIESSKINKNLKEDNPFVSSVLKKNSNSKIIPQNKCICHTLKKKHTICKRKHNKILKEPVLKLSQSYGINRRSECQQHFIKGNFSVSSLLNTSENLYLHSLVDTCNQLHISTEKRKSSDRPTDINDNSKWWRNDVGNDKTQNREPISERSSSSSCSQQALNPPCDVTIDELASYFETLVHIPKKMSSMAEMMYI
ncbi:uncharacterized protein LOC123694306 [Colias croceus]|uniref:uncharacterized protein LOC123694306 n=1 Tax=Colias crocea TaxID=72248 RepID=UPI001E27A5EA|nr:uncharacterized protein LOC123694306 [Colias croceus]XP_045495662.1 uncharacterized protein LOC123694306 [Colias croceus]